MGSALKFNKASQLGRQPGEVARLKVIQGPDAGCTYVLTAGLASIGRGDENDIQINDLKASRRHAEFVFANGTWNLRDLGSANGVMHNLRTTRGTLLRTGDIVGMGETQLEFMAADAGTAMLQAPARDSNQVGAAQGAFEQQRQKVLALGGGGAGLPNARPPSEHLAVPGLAGLTAGVNNLSGVFQNKRIVLYGGAAAILALVLFGGDSAPKKVAKKDTNRDLASYLPGGPPPPAAVSRTAEMFFKTGFREYNEGNYLRARAQFETVTQMQPDHALARLYLANCDLKITALVKKELQLGKRAADSGKYHEAKGYYESVQRLLYRDQSNPNFIEARDQLADVMKAMKGDAGT